MSSHNRWTGGDVKLIVPPLPPSYHGQSGALFQTLVFSPQVGQEVALFLLDDPAFARELGQLKPFHLNAKTGAVRTSAGLIAFVIWTVSSDGRHIVDYEHPLNPFHADTIEMLSALGRQTHLKVVILDSIDSEVVGFYELDNNFRFDRLAAGLSKLIRQEPVADFSATQAALRREFSLEQLKGA